METLTTTELSLLILATICFFGIIMFAIGIYSNKKVTKFFDQSDNQMSEMPTYPTDADYLADMQRKMEAIEQPQPKPTEVPAKRSHASRRSAFSLEQALSDGMAILVDGKSHVYVGLKSQYPFDELYYIRGISNGQAYGVTQATDKGKIRNNIYDVKELNRYLINIRK